MAVAGETSASAATHDGAIDVFGLVELILRRKWLILGTTVAVVALALTALWVVGPRYKATARLLIDPRELRVLQNEVVQPSLGSDMVLVESQVEIVTSETVLSRVVERENLVADEDFFKPKPGESNARTPQEIAVESLAKATKVTRPENTYIIEIAVTAKEPAKAARLANAIASAYTQDQAESGATATQTFSSSIEERLAELQAKLKADEDKVAEYKTANRIAAADGRMLLDSRINELSTRLSAAVGESAQAKSRYEVLQNALRQRGDVSSVLSDTENATMVGLRSVLTEAQRNLAELQQVLGPRHPRVGAAQAEVTRATQAIRAESERLVAATRDAWRAAVDTEESLAASVKQLTDQSFTANDKLIQLRELERQAQASRLVYESYLVRAKETAELGNLGSRSARTIAPAAVPDSPAFPPRSLLAAAAAIFGFGLGVFNAIVADLLEKRRGLRPRAARAVPASAIAAPAAAVVVAERMVMTLAVSDGVLSGEAALRMARDAATAGRSTLLLDLHAKTEPGLAELSRGEAAMSDILSRDPYSQVHLASAGAAWRGVDLARLPDIVGVFADAYDRVVVNGGVLHGEASELAAAFIEHADHVVIVVPGNAMSVDERAIYEELLAAGGLEVSVMSMADELPARAA